MSIVGPTSVLFAGGGTGGHLFPGIAVAQELIRRYPATTVMFVGAGRVLELQLLAREGFFSEHIRTSGLAGKSGSSLLRGLILIPVSMFDASRLIRRHSPDLVVGLGGYSSGPVVVAGWQQGVPTLLLEQNVIPGITNRILARFVSAAAVSYEATLPYFGTKGFVSGNPVRQGFFEAPTPKSELQTVRVLVIGGSQGAHAINVAMVKASKTILASSRPIHLIHQSGKADFDFVKREYQRAGLSAQVEPFIDQMDSEMAKSDLIVCRAGATTLAEVSAAGRAAIVIPFPHATNDHQRRNAIELNEAGAIEVIDPRELSGTVLGAQIVSLACNDVRRVALAERSRKFSRPKAACCIVDKMEQLFDQNNAV